MKPAVNADAPAASWTDGALRDPHRCEDKSARVEAMFDAIAPTYERVNSVASFGRDTAWRRRAVAAASILPTDTVLDVACGTGDMLRAFAAGSPAPSRLIGVDFAAGMLAQGRYGGLPRRPMLLRADAQRLPLRDAAVDVVSCAFGVRNFQELQRGLNEFRRVLRAGGRVVILEFSMPQSALLRWPYRLYTEFVLPRIGALLSGDRNSAYRYLPNSIRTFESRDAMIQRLGDAGFVNVLTESMNFGGVVLYRGEA